MRLNPAPTGAWISFGIPCGNYAGACARVEFIRRHVPELAKVPAKFIHAPWKMSRAGQFACGCVIGRDYPTPVVDHAVQRERALALYRKPRP